VQALGELFNVLVRKSGWARDWAYRDIDMAGRVSSGADHRSIDYRSRRSLR